MHLKANGNAQSLNSKYTVWFDPGTHFYFRLKKNKAIFNAPFPTNQINFKSSTVSCCQIKTWPWQSGTWSEPEPGGSDTQASWWSQNSGSAAWTRPPPNRRRGRARMSAGTVERKAYSNVVLHEMSERSVWTLERSENISLKKQDSNPLTVWDISRSVFTYQLIINIKSHI